MADVSYTYYETVEEVTLPDNTVAKQITVHVVDGDYPVSLSMENIQAIKALSGNTASETINFDTLNVCGVVLVIVAFAILGALCVSHLIARMNPR